METEKEEYLIKINNFEGPLDLLCYLIDRNKMDIFNIKLDEVTYQYIEYMQTMEKLDLDIASEFLVMAATLVYLKSRKLLPLLEPEEEDSLSEEELARRIIEYKKYKEVASIFKERYEIFGDRISKAPDNVKLPKAKIEKIYSKDIIVNIYLSMLKKNEVLQNLNYENINKLAQYEKVTVRTKAKEIIRKLMQEPKFIFNKLFSNNEENKLDVVTSFLSLLELAKLKRISVNQKESFGDIVVEKKEK